MKDRETNGRDASDRGANESDGFWRQIADSQDQLLSKVSAVQREIRRLPADAPRRSGHRPLALSLIMAAGVATAGLVMVLRARSLTFEVGDSKAAGEIGVAIAALERRPIDLRFSDGSTLQLAPEASARVTDVDPRGAAILVERGRAEVSVVPRRGGSWRVDMGPFRILVKGTRFSAAWDPFSERLDFYLDKGAVVITGRCLDRARELVAGQSLHASCRWVPADRPPVDAQRAHAPAASTPSAEAPREDDSALAPQPSGRAEAPSEQRPARLPWRQLASSQRYSDALAAAEREGFENECRRAGAGDLLTLGDVARLAGSPDRAVEAYQAARRKRSAADRSAFAIGLVEFDQRKQFSRAAEWFATYLREQPRGPLAEEAEGRLMEAWQRAGEGAKAREAGQAYLARHPQGAYADLARRLTPR